MKRCTICLYPDTKPDLTFDENGKCSACQSYERRAFIDWDERKKDLLALLDRHNGRCIVPSSGGKDSHYQVLKLLELGATPIIVTATTCHLTHVGRKNIDNLSRYATTIEYTPNRTVRAILNRRALDLVGDISWPEHASIFSVPFRFAVMLDIPLIFYGENPQNQYGGPPDSDSARTMTRRWVSEFGGFLGLRQSDFIGQDGIKAHHMEDYLFPSEMDVQRAKLEAHFLGQYLPWDSHENARIAREAGMAQFLPTPANYWIHENLDNAQTGIHDRFCFLKYGYGRACAQISMDIRAGKITRNMGLNLLNAIEKRNIYPYCGVSLETVLEHIGMSHSAYAKLERQWDSYAI